MHILYQKLHKELLNVQKKINFEILYLFLIKLHQHCSATSELSFLASIMRNPCINIVFTFIYFILYLFNLEEIYLIYLIYLI